MVPTDSVAAENALAAEKLAQVLSLFTITDEDVGDTQVSQGERPPRPAVQQT
jgi:hypothetical protein